MSLLAVHRVALAAVVLTLLCPAAVSAQSITEFHTGITPGTPPGPLAATPYGITAGPDGNVWFTEFNAQPDRADHAGRRRSPSSRAGITRQPAVRDRGRPGRQLWFTELSGDRDRPDHAGRGRSPSSPSGTSARGPSGSRRARTATSGSPSSAATAIGADHPGRRRSPSSPPHHRRRQSDGIAAGPDGNLWFTESTATGSAGSRRPGSITEFSPASPPGASRGIAAGPDGNLWFTEVAGDRIGRITPAGVDHRVHRRHHPDSRPDGITAGPDGNLWFTEDPAIRSAGSRRPAWSPSSRPGSPPAAPSRSASRRARTATCGSRSRTSSRSGG